MFFPFTKNEWKYVHKKITEELLTFGASERYLFFYCYTWIICAIFQTTEVNRHFLWNDIVKEFFVWTLHNYTRHVFFLLTIIYIIQHKNEKIVDFYYIFLHTFCRFTIYIQTRKLKQILTNCQYANCSDTL